MTEDENFRRLRAQKQLIELVREVGAEAERQGLTEEQLREELAITREELFREKYEVFDRWRGCLRGKLPVESVDDLMEELRGERLPPERHSPEGDCP